MQWLTWDWEGTKEPVEADTVEEAMIKADELGLLLHGVPLKEQTDFIKKRNQEKGMFWYFESSQRMDFVMGQDPRFSEGTCRFESGPALSETYQGVFLFNEYDVVAFKDIMQQHNIPYTHKKPKVHFLIPEDARTQSRKVIYADNTICHCHGSLEGFTKLVKKGAYVVKGYSDHYWTGELFGAKTTPDQIRKQAEKTGEYLNFSATKPLKDVIYKGFAQ